MKINNIHPEFQLNGKTINNIAELIDESSKTDPKHTEFLKEWFDQNDFIIAKTSGSTGKPKKIKIQKNKLINSARKTIRCFDLKPKTKALLNLSSEYIAGKLMWIRALTGGWHLDVIQADNQSISEKLKNNIYDFGAMVPLQVYQNLHYIHQINKLIVGGGVVSNELQKKINELPNRIYATYGMTETLTHIAIKPLNKKAEENFYSDNKLKGSYRLLEGIKIDKDEKNCLIIKAPEISENEIHTKDIVKIIDEKHFCWLGRYDNIINSGGIKLIPEKIEKKISKLIQKPFFVAGIPDKKLGEKLVLIIESKAFEVPDFSTILDKYEIPKKNIFINNFIRTNSGKIQRKKTIEKILINRLEK